MIFLLVVLHAYILFLVVAFVVVVVVKGVDLQSLETFGLCA